MRHRIYGKQLNRKSEHRRAMLRNLAAGLFEHGQIETTMPKAKAVQPFVEKLITMAKKSKGLQTRRRVEALLRVRAKLLRLLPKNKYPHLNTLLQYPTHPDGYSVDDIGPRSLREKWAKSRG